MTTSTQSFTQAVATEAITSPLNVQANHTPLQIKPRRMTFPFASMGSRYFFDDNLLKSAYMAALSATFPAGEGEFIETVRLFRDEVEDPELKEQIRGFIGQEGHHSHQHKQFNQTLKTLGFDAVRLEQVFEKDMTGDLVGKSNAERLAYTVCFEHQTAILANELITNPNVLKGMDETIYDLMMWHAVEEIEHKSVAFDLYMLCVGDRALLRKVQKEATAMFMRRISKYMFLLIFWSKTMPRWRDIKGYIKFMVGKGGLLRNLRKPYTDFFRKDFHPWDHQNQDLVDVWKDNHYKAEQDRGSDSYPDAKVTLN